MAMFRARRTRSTGMRYAEPSSPERQYLRLLNGSIAPFSLGLAWQLDGRVLSAPGQQKALRRATEEDITGAGINLRAEITTQYLNSLQAAAHPAEVVRAAREVGADRIIRGCGRELAEAGFHVAIFSFDQNEPSSLDKVLAIFRRAEGELEGE